MLLLLQTLLTAAYLAVVGRVWLLKRRGAGLPGPALPAADQAPETAVGLPPGGDEFVSYVDEGIAALDDYLSEGFAT